MAPSPTVLPPGIARPDRGPSLADLVAEVATPVHALRLLPRLPGLLRGPRVDGGAPPVLTIPGYMTPELTLAPLTAYLRHLGHDARGYGLGHNTSDVVGRVRELVPVVREIAAVRGPVALVGWSLGGLVAREVARDVPQAVSRVVTFGTPVIGGPIWTTARHAYSRRAVEAYAAAADARVRFPLRVPVTAMVARRDGVVAWRAQVDHHSPDVTHHRIRSSHLAMGLDPDVWARTAEVLAEDAAARTAPAADDRRRAA